MKQNAPPVKVTLETLAALRVPAPDSVTSAPPSITSTSSDAEMLAAAAREPELLHRLTREVQVAYLTARAAQGADWSGLDTSWYAFGCELRRHANLPQMMPQNSPVERAAKAAAIRAALRSLQDFLGKAVPEISLPERLALQSAPAWLHAARLRGENHPQEPAFVGAVR